MVNQENGVDLKSATQSDERKLFIETYGCQMNVADSEVVASIMKMDGYSMTENIEEADAIFVNTCSVRDNAEQKIYGRLQYFQSLKRKKKRAVSMPAGTQVPEEIRQKCRFHRGIPLSSPGRTKNDNYYE